MQIRWVEKGRQRAVVAAALAAAAQIAAGIWQGSPLWAGLPLWTNLPLALLLGAFAFIAFGTRITVNRWWGAIAELACVAGASFIILHLPLLHWMGMRLMGLVRGLSFFFAAFRYMSVAFMAVVLESSFPLEPR